MLFFFTRENSKHDFLAVISSAWVSQSFPSIRKLCNIAKVFYSQTLPIKYRLLMAGCPQIPHVAVMLCVPVLLTPWIRLHLTPWGQKGIWGFAGKGEDGQRWLPSERSRKVCIFVGLKSCRLSLKIISHQQKHERQAKPDLRDWFKHLNFLGDTFHNIYQFDSWSPEAAYVGTSKIWMQYGETSYITSLLRQFLNHFLKN